MKPRISTTFRVLLIALSLLLLINLAVVTWNTRPLLEQRGIYIPFLPTANPLVSLAGQAQSPTPFVAALDPTDTPVPISLQDGISPFDRLRSEGVLIFSMKDGSKSHLFAYHPLYLPLVRLTNQPWDDITPSLSPDGSQVAFSSHQDGDWDLYILDLVTGKQEQLTNTPEYEASPSWSPDGQWLVYEKYSGGNLDLYLLSLADRLSDPIQLTQDPGVDRSPAWSPRGREIAFVSSRNGNEEIWLARLDKIDDRFMNISRSLETQDRSPAWSSDGSHLVWSSELNGDRKLMVWGKDNPEQPARTAGEGNQAAWSPDGKVLFSEVRDAQSSSLTAFSSDTGRLSLPLTPLPGSLNGMAWIKGPLVGWLAEQVENPQPYIQEILWEPKLTKTVAPAGRMGLVPLQDVSAPQPLLHDAVDEAFVALRQQIAVETGWDALSSLENAYVALTTPPIPSIQNDWLYTGRAFALNPLLMSAGWVVIAKEEFAGQVFWRVYLKARYQDGSMGVPLTSMTWDINARYNGDPKSFEEGGQPGNPPEGYWVDMTELASRYGWIRLPAWINWRTFYPSIRFNQFVMTGGLDWTEAMAEMYPLEALQTATSVPTITLTPTYTLIPTATPVTKTPTFTQTVPVTPTATPTPDNR